MEEPQLQYKMVKELLGHTSDVRGIANTNDGDILSCSRDMSTRLWKKESDSFTFKHAFEGHRGFVASVCYYPPCSKFSKGLVITGGNDSQILCFTLDPPILVNSLRGHSGTVCALSLLKSRPYHLLSGSWDNSARCWDIINGTSFCLRNHGSPVWCIIQLGNGIIVSGSADKYIFCYKDNGSMHQILESGHKDCVRAFCEYSDDEFLSAGNDGTVIKWKLPDGTKTVLITTDSFIYCMAVNHKLNMLYWCGESNNLCFYKFSTATATKVHVPAISVWCLTVLPNSDVAIGCSDSIVRIFSRCADGEEAPMDICVGSQMVGSDLTSIDPSSSGMLRRTLQAMRSKKIPNLNKLSGPDLLCEAGRHSDDIRIVREGFHAVCYKWACSQWAKVGKKVGCYNEKDIHLCEPYFFSIDIEDNKPHLELTFDFGSDPWDVADNFVKHHGLPFEYIKKIVDFILVNVINDFANSGSPEIENVYFPLENYISFDKSNSSILAKLEEFNLKVDEEIRLDPSLFPILKKLAEEDHEEEFSLKTFYITILKWPPEYLFPGLDILRLCIRFESVNKAMSSLGCFPPLMDQLLRIIIDSDYPLNQIMALRVVSNLFRCETGVLAATQHWKMVLKYIASLNLTNAAPGLQVAASTTLLNFVIFGARIVHVRRHCLKCIQNLFPKINDKEAVLRILSSIGSLISYCGIPFIPKELVAELEKLKLRCDLSESHAEKCYNQLLEILI